MNKQKFFAASFWVPRPSDAPLACFDVLGRNAFSPRRLASAHGAQRVKKFLKAIDIDVT
ncbi:MAG TPA: hypothetical protein VN441_08915 [Syntrophomonas sp.]|nr:hypothetical protein [Syntrophomonas sp.]